MAKRGSSEGAAVAKKKPRKQVPGRDRKHPATDSKHSDGEDVLYEEENPPFKKSKDSCGDSVKKQRCRTKRRTDNERKTVGKEIQDPTNLTEKTLIIDMPVKQFSGSEDAEESEDEWEDVQANNQRQTGTAKRKRPGNSKAGGKNEKRLSVKSNIKKRSRPDGDDGFEEESYSVKKRKPTVPGVKGKTKAAKPASHVSCAANAGDKKPRAKKSAVKKQKTKETEILDLLALEKKTQTKVATVEESSVSEEAEDSDEEWEDVEELNGPVDCLQASTSTDIPLPTQPVEIEIETAESAKKRLSREKRKAEYAAYMRKLLRKFSKEVREDTHKVHLLCLLANGFYRNDTCNLPDLQAVALSVIPVKFTSVPAECVDVVYLTNLMKWFFGTFTLSSEMSLDESEPLSATLERRFGVYGVRDESEMVHVFLVILRALQLMSRLVLSLQPIPLKDKPAKTKKSPKEKSSRRSSTKPQTPKDKTNSSNRQQVRQKKVKQEETLSGESEEENPKHCTTSGKGKGKTTKEKKGVKSADKEKPGAQPKNQLRRKAASKVTYKEESESCGHSSDSDYCLSDAQDSDYSDWEEEPLASKRRRSSGPVKEIIKTKRNTNSAAKQPRDKNSPNSVTQPKRRGKIISTDDESEMDDEDKMWKSPLLSPTVSDQWVEVYLESEGKWLCVDCMHRTLGKAQDCFKTTTKPVTYVVGIDNAGCVKDVTRRYDSNWMTSTRMRRIDPDWWEKTLMPYKSPNIEREDREDTELDLKLLDQPLPTSFPEYKNHPLYVLKRHLLKYEAIYPETSAVMGYFRGEAVYSRSCVHNLHSSDTWLKEARVVRLAEVPYKMVKGSSNRARKARISDPEKKKYNDLGLFGLWQTEEYQPPVAVDGKVPRNEYGNVYLFQPSMLPIGCVQLRVPNLHRVARKLDIDCVQAITGFDFHCGFSHPVTDGYVVCEEHKDILLSAWENEQANIEQKQKEKREKRALGNWKLLIKGLLIRERLKARYGNKDTDTPGLSTEANDFSSDDEEKQKTETPAQDMAVSWPQNRQAQATEGKTKSRRQKKGEENHLFPFEKL
ncbi:DNA repair protein complementing XP-C cells isoform X2 [Xenopus laevis]|uniref:DNA repair protein complementing XP-C cells isoform X2 n=2 Tax=Xenopus laevis TaxID=8355 RepID=A0A1L8GPS3_XENLA|nr:DNA repair protein complementing XP-C cells isoform X2 [Xenopus laevis]OCT85789.1 hypothetical protein XELAEV_18023960mg [Xenopus laevis]